MGIFGIPTRKEITALRDEIEALKAGKRKYESWQLETAEGESWNMPNPAIYQNQADLFRVFSPLTSAISVVADTIALAESGVFRLRKGDEPEEIKNHEFDLLLDNPNPEDSRSELMFGFAVSYELNGNAILWLNKKNAKAPPVEIWNIPYHMIQPVPDGKMYLKGYIYTATNGEQISLETWEVVHCRRYNQNSRFTGLSIVECIALIAQGDLGMQDWNTRLFRERNGELPDILAFKNMVEDGMWEKIKDDKRNAAHKRETMMLRGVGDTLQWLQKSGSQKEMEFLGGRAANKSEVYSLYPGLESMTDKNATEANANAGKRTFTENVIWPRLVRIAEKFVNKILYVYTDAGVKVPVYEDGITYHFKDPRITDRQLELQERAADERIMTVGELRKKYPKIKELGDERDDLLPAQIAAQASQPEEPVAIESPAEEEEKPETIQGQEPPVDVDNPEPDNNALKAELDKWKRKAVKKIGQAVSFESGEIPEPVRGAIMSALPACKSASEVRDLFAKHEAAAPAPKEILLLARSIERLLEKAIE